MKILVENKYGHGAIPTPFKRIGRFLRHNLAMAGEPFNWVEGYDVENKIGKITIKDQGSSYSCGGQAGSYFLEIQGRLRNMQDAISAKSIYSRGCDSRDGGGMDFDSLITEICAHGGNTEPSVPSYDIYSQPLNEPSMEDQSWITDTLTLDALKRAGYTPCRIKTDMESVAQAIRDNGAVIWQIIGQNNGTWLSPYPQPPYGRKGLWAHYLCAKSARLNNGVKEIGAFQSWGTDVGLNGIQYFTQNYFDSRCIVEAYTFIYDPKLKPIPGNNSIWASVWQWFEDNIFNPKPATSKAV